MKTGPFSFFSCAKRNVCVHFFVLVAIVLYINCKVDHLLAFCIEKSYRRTQFSHSHEHNFIASISVLFYFYFVSFPRSAGLLIYYLENICGFSLCSVAQL
jgi:hypothetical protein